MAFDQKVLSLFESYIRSVRSRRQEKRGVALLKPDIGGEIQKAPVFDILSGNVDGIRLGRAGGQ